MAVFILTAKINRKKLILTLCAAAVMVMGGWAAGMWSARSAAAAGGADPKGVKTAEDRVEYLKGWGWEVSPQAKQVEELQMPEQFGSEYQRYLELQRDQGFELTKYAGKRIRRYTYDVLNYPTGESGVTAHLLIYRNTVIGGEILGNGFLNGLARPE